MKKYRTEIIDEFKKWCDDLTKMGFHKNISHDLFLSVFNRIADEHTSPTKATKNSEKSKASKVSNATIKPDSVAQSDSKSDIDKENKKDGAK